MQDAYLVDLGILIFEGEDEFDAYAIAYDKKYGYYDENQYYTLDREAALQDAQDYLDEEISSYIDGPRRYAVITETWIEDDITQQDIDDGNVPVEDEHYLVEDAIFAKANIDGEQVDLFE